MYAINKYKQQFIDFLGAYTGRTRLTKSIKNNVLDSVNVYVLGKRVRFDVYASSVHVRTRPLIKGRGRLRLDDYIV